MIVVPYYLDDWTEPAMHRPAPTRLARVGLFRGRECSTSAPPCWESVHSLLDVVVSPGGPLPELHRGRL